MNELIPPDDRFAEAPRSQAPQILSGTPGQGTMIEQARAVADVRAAIMIAREDPRDEANCVAEMRRACSMKEMAEVAFFRVKRGKDDSGVDNMVTGPTIDLANELSRCWRNINSGHKELSRNEQTGQSEVLAYAWDIEKNNRREQTIIVPHKRGKHRVHDTQGIREVIAGVAARVEREMIFKVLPTWFRIQAVELCHETLAKGDGKSMEQRIADCKAAFYGIDIMADALERKIGRAAAQWTPEDIAILTVVYKSIRRGQSEADDEFPSAKAQVQPDNVAALERALTQETAIHDAPAANVSESVPIAPQDRAGATGGGEARLTPPGPTVPVEQDGAPPAPAPGTEAGGGRPQTPPPADPPKTWTTVHAWAKDMRLAIEALPTIEAVEVFEAEDGFAGHLARAREKTLKIAQEIEDAIEDRKTFLASKETIERQKQAQGAA